MSETTRPRLYDLTYVIRRLGGGIPSGIERVDLMCAGHFAGSGAPLAAGLHYGVRGPHVLRPEIARAIVAEAGSAWRQDAAAPPDAALAGVERWLAEPPRPGEAVRRILPERHRTASWPVLAHRLQFQLAHHRGTVIPRDALYLNIAQYGFEFARLFAWLETRPDVRGVFFVHDLLPLDYPELFREGYAALFDRRVDTIARHAAALLVSSQTVADRVETELKRRGRTGVPCLVAPLPPPLHAFPAASQPPVAGGTPYFVVLGTIEPRKNHLLLLQVWRRLVAAGGAVPRLVIVGARGWDNEQVLDHLGRSSKLAPHVLELSGVSTATLQTLVAGANALLMPSFDEGYGLPVAEALAAGTPVVASDIPVFREVSQGRALLIDPLDGRGWQDAVTALAEPGSGLRTTWVKAAASYRAPQQSAFFDAIDRFLARI